MNIKNEKYLMDNLWIRICFEEGKVELSYFESVLRCFSDSFIPGPDIIRLPDGLEYNIGGFLDTMILSNIQQELAGKKESIQTLFRNDSNTTILDPNGTIYAEISSEYVTPGIVDGLYNMMKEIINETRPYFMGCAFRSINSQIYRKYFQWQDRSWYSPTLVWLQYFGPEETKIQGGTEILKNPYIQTEKLGDGLLVQVGDTPFDAFTPDGEALLVNATKAMPPIIKEQG